MKHSPTPWTIERTSDQVTIVAADGYNIISIPIDPEYGRPDEDEANARLVEAAPELLQGLIGLSRAMEPFHKGSRLLGDIERLIAKAEGRS